MVFDQTGSSNTENALQTAVETAVSQELDIVVATNSGSTAKMLLKLSSQIERPPRLIAVTQVYGFKAPGENAMSPEVRRFLTQNGVEVVTAAHALSGGERGLSKTFHGIYPVEIVASTLRMFGQGVKVCVEVSIMALDCGQIQYGKL